MVLCLGFALPPAAAFANGDMHRGTGIASGGVADDPLEMTRLAQRYEHAEGVEKDFIKANELYCRAAKAGHAEAQFRLGWIYANGGVCSGTTVSRRSCS